MGPVRMETGSQRAIITNGRKASGSSGCDGRRGRRPIDLKSQRELREKRASIEKYLRIGTEEEFVKAMLGFGLHEGSQALSDALEAWREYRA